MNQHISIDFDIMSNGVNTIMVVDNSYWAYAETQPAYISITIPGSFLPKTFSLTKNKINTFNSHNLGLSCFSGDCNEQFVELPDGIYTIRINSNFEDIYKERFFLKTDRFELEFAKIAIKHGFEYSENDIEFQNKMFDVKWILIVAQSHAKIGDFVKAQRFFEQAKKLLKSC